MRTQLLLGWFAVELWSASVARAEVGGEALASAPAPLSAPGESAYPQLQDPEGGADVPGAEAEVEAPAASAARAEVPPPGLGDGDGAAPPLFGAQFVSLDRADASSRAGAELSYVSIDGGVTPLRLALWGQYVAPGGLGAFGALDLSYATGDGDSESAIGNVELGALYARTFGSVQAIARASVLLPTAGDGLSDFLINVLCMTSRLTDFTHAYPNSTWLRLAASPVVRSGPLLMRADLGADVAVQVEGDDDVDPLLRANAAVGYVQGAHQLSAEFVSVISADGFDSLHSLGATYRGTFGKLSPYGGLFVYFSGDDGREDQPDFGLTGGVSSTF